MSDLQPFTKTAVSTGKTAAEYSEPKYCTILALTNRQQQPAGTGITISGSKTGRVIPHDPELYDISDCSHCDLSPDMQTQNTGSLRPMSLPVKYLKFVVCFTWRIILR